MNSKKLLIGLLATLFLLSFVLIGCQETTGIAQEAYDELKAQYEEISDRYQELVNEPEDIQPEIPDLSDELAAAQSEIAELQSQIDDLTDRYVLEGDNTVETIEKLLRFYYDTHTYSVNVYDCDNMAADVWNQLITLDINAVIAIGSLDYTVTDITQTNHAWVMAEVSPGEWLALEATGGRIVTKSENPLYYVGWTLETPAAYRKHNLMVRQFNTLVKVYNDIVTEDNAVIMEYNQSGNQQTADKLMAVHNKLQELLEQYDAQLAELKAEIESQATKCGG